MNPYGFVLIKVMFAICILVIEMGTVSILVKRLELWSLNLKVPVSKPTIVYPFSYLAAPRLTVNRFKRALCIVL